jgi:branched-chain amino acid transport system substrate-binding protein
MILITDRRKFLMLAGSGLVLAGTSRMSAIAAGEDIRIGALLPLTGGGAAFGANMQKMYEALAAEINAAGGVSGSQIKIFTEDDQTNPDAGVRAAKKLIDVNHVNAIVGTFASSVTLAVLPLVVEAKIPLFAVSSSPAITTAKDDDFVYRTSPSDAVGSTVFVAAALKKGFKKVALLLQNSPFGLGLGDSFATQFEKAGGTITDKVVYNLDQASYRAEIDKAFSGKPDVILFGGYTPDGIQIFKEAYQLGNQGMWMGFAWAFGPDFVAAIGADAAASSVLVVDPLPNTASSAFAEATKLNGGTAPDLFGDMAYDHLMILACAIQAANGDTSGEAIKAKIRQVANPPGKVVGTWAEALPLLKAGEKINYEGASGSCDFDENGDTITAHGVFSLPGGVQKLDITILPSDLKSL